MQKLDNILMARQLVHFAAIAESGSLNKAAKRIGIAQSALTRSVRQLEEQMDCQLFLRGPRGSMITPEGEALLDCTHRIRSETGLALMAISHASKQKKPLIRIGAAPAFGLGVLPDAISAFQTQHPKVQVQIRQSAPASLMDMLISSELDIYVGPISGTDPASGVEVVPIGSVQSLVYAKAGHPLTGPNVVGYADLVRFKWISLIEASGSTLPGAWRRKLERFAYEDGLTPPEIAIETNSAVGALNIAARGDYLVCLSGMFLEDARSRGLSCLRLKEPLTAYENGVAYRSALGRSTLALGLIDAIKSVAKDAAGQFG